MKTLNNTIAILQVPLGPTIDEDVFNISATILVVALFMIFILSLVKKILAHRLRKKIIEKGIPENLAASILNQNSDHEGDTNLKWFAILTGISIGLILVHYSLPLGIHSLAILSLCIALSFLGYFLYIKKTKK
jgi:hypothetical protein